MSHSSALGGPLMRLTCSLVWALCSSSSVACAHAAHLINWGVRGAEPATSSYTLMFKMLSTMVLPGQNFLSKGMGDYYWHPQPVTWRAGTCQHLSAKPVF